MNCHSGNCGERDERGDHDERDESHTAGPQDDAAGDDFASRRERRQRIARDLADELRRAAGELRIPVANLVRGVVDEALDAAERVSEDLGGVVEEWVDHAMRARRGLAARGFGRRWARRGERGPGPEPTASRTPGAEAGEAGTRAETPREGAASVRRPAAIVGWVAITLEQEASCATCWRALERGDAAHLGVATQQAGPPTLVCPACRQGRYPAG